MCGFRIGELLTAVVRSARRLPPVYPSVFAVVLMLSIYVGSRMSPYGLIRPLTITILVGLSLTQVLIWAMGD